MTVHVYSLSQRVRLAFQHRRAGACPCLSSVYSAHPPNQGPPWKLPGEHERRVRSIERVLIELAKAPIKRSYRKQSAALGVTCIWRMIVRTPSFLASAAILLRAIHATRSEEEEREHRRSVRRQPREWRTLLPAPLRRKVTGDEGWGPLARSLSNAALPKVIAVLPVVGGGTAARALPHFSATTRFQLNSSRLNTSGLPPEFKFESWQLAQQF